ncbi:MAG TPA: cob(I)yrinic acid a,c-diamide adenosyltransferase [Symbiobacteriaceae bacterium]|jgi:cob(I)alamin adenosyltransferase
MRGLVMVNTGDGKGKSTAAMGQIVRAVGAGMNVLMIQFLKGDWKAAEIEGLKHLPGFELRRFGLGFVMPRRRTHPIEAHQARVVDAWAQTVLEVASDHWDLIVLDEINVVLSNPELNCVLPTDDVLKLLADRPPRLHMILTGRRAPAEIIVAADMVTEMVMVKHHYTAGVAAQRGIEF